MEQATESGKPSIAALLHKFADHFAALEQYAQLKAFNCGKEHRRSNVGLFWADFDLDGKTVRLLLDEHGPRLGIAGSVDIKLGEPEDMEKSLADLETAAYGALRKEALRRRSNKGSDISVW